MYSWKMIMGTVYTAKLVKFNRNLAISITTNHSNVVVSISRRREKRLESYESQ